MLWLGFIYIPFIANPAILFSPIGVEDWVGEAYVL